MEINKNKKKKNKSTYALPIFRFFFNDLFDLFYFFGTFQLLLCTLIQITRFDLYKLQWIGGRFRWCSFCYTSPLHVFRWIVGCYFLKKNTNDKNVEKFYIYDMKKRNRIYTIASRNMVELKQNKQQQHQKSRQMQKMFF